MATSTSSNSTSSSGRLGSASPSTSVICQEVFDETCEPSPDEIHEYAFLLGIDPVKEPHLLYLAKDGLMQALPPDWKICYSEEKCGHYYYNTKTKQSQWDHPLDAVFRELVEQARQKAATVATPIIDNSADDASSQIDSGIRSLQGNDDCDNTNNTNEMSSPVSNVLHAGAGATSKQAVMGAVTGANAVLGGACSSSGPSSASMTSTSGFSGGVSRFLESRTKNYGLTFQPLKNTRFEVAKTNPQLGLKFGNDAATFAAPKMAATPVHKVEPVESSGHVEKKGFTLSGTGAMFLKSRRQIETGLNQATAMLINNSGGGANMHVEGVIGTPPGVKGILRDSSLTDMRRRTDKEEHDTCVEDKKSVRFNLEDTKLRGSPEEDVSSSRRLTQSPEVSINSDDDDDAADDDDPWDDDYDEVDCVGVGMLSAEGAAGYMRSLNPFLASDEQQLRDIKVIPLPKSQTIQMLKAQSFSMDVPERERAKLSELARSQSVEVAAPASVCAVSYLDKLKDSSLVKPLYEDTDSESKGSSVRSFIINKSEQDSLQSNAAAALNNPFDLEELGRKHSREVEQLELKLQSAASGGSAGVVEKTGLRTLKVASKLVGFLKKDFDKPSEREGPSALTATAAAATAKTQLERDSAQSAEALRHKLEQEQQALLKEERERLEEQLQQQIDDIKHEHEHKLKNIRHEYELRLTSHRHQLEESADLQLEQYRTQLEDELDAKRKSVVAAHKAQMSTLQQNHAELLQELERDLKSEAELLRKEHATKLAEMRDKLSHELELERQRMRDTGEDRLYEKLRCEKRLLEDKYRCLKEKYVRLKTDVKLSLERRNRRREAQALQQQSLHTNTTTTTGSETERSNSCKPSIGNSENRSLSLSTSCQERGASLGSAALAGGRAHKPPVPPKTHLTAAAAGKEQQQQQRVRERERDRSVESAQLPPQLARKPGIASKYIKHLQVQDDNTSLSQSDTTISNNYTKGRYLPVGQPALSDNGNSDSEAYQCQQENNNNSARKKVFSRLKSASTSRLNSDNYKSDRPCTPVENLRNQLQKLEDLEDQFPDNTLDTTYHLRYPFSDISNDPAAGTSSELEFFKHRIHLERDSVRRAKESLRTQRTNFRARQREIKQRHKASVTRHTLDQLIQEEKELTEMEVNLHRTRALLGEKVIRLRHLEQSLLRIYEKEKPSMDLLGVEPKDDATLSDLSSHSSSGFSSTDFASAGGDTHNLNKRKELYHQESSECIQNLEILNAEIREILDILGKNPAHGGGGGGSSGGGMSVPMISPSELNWSHMLSAGAASTAGGAQHTLHAQQVNVMHTPQSIPTLADRLETYRQLASGRMQTSMLAANTIVSQHPRAMNYTTSLVERTRDLRNWLRQAKTEHEMLTGMAAAAAAQQHHAHAAGALGLLGGAASSAAGIGGGGGGGVVGGGSGGSAGAGAQANL